ncbi:NlpC/P60 family protein [Cellulomonas rhizosphaerae]|uniref:NlpC/P60 family protein n=1 Tax=Cellulomonas rhizosphaerae TaxID=2293719 RepID=A0A413RRM7_9CELL|nr:NlpC/P60 family protein [Cellulomonas rhizosphaerae]
MAAVQSRVQELRALVAPTSTTASGTTTGGAAAASGSTAAAFQTALAEATGTSGVAGTATTTGTTTDTGIAPGSGVTAQDLIATAKKYLGVPYVWGGESLSEGGLDCSGLVLRSLTDLGVDGVPRTARQQMHLGEKVASMDDAKPGDLLVFGGGTHIAIYLGDGKMIDAPKPGGHVNIRDVYATPTAIRRILPQEGAAVAAAPDALATDAASLASLLGGGGGSPLGALSGLAPSGQETSTTDASRLAWELLAGVAS